MIKLVVSDIDGTLVPDGSNEINEELYDTILKLRMKGIQFAAASGRQWASIEKIFEPIKEKIFYLSDNGAYIGCSGRNLFLNTIEPSLAKALVADIRKNPELIPMLGTTDEVYVDTDNEAFIHWLVDGYKFRVKKIDDLLKVEEPIIKVSAYRVDQIQEATKNLVEIYGDQLKMTISGEMWLDCMKLGVNKGEAVRLLQESLDITPQETMVFGDQLNDVEMMHQAYYSFAIGNARPEVKQAARFEADTNVNDGVLKILKNLV